MTKMFVVVKTIEGSLFSVKELTEEGTCYLGSSPENDIQLASTYVSRRHAKIVMVKGHCFIVDEGSRNGTRVNGEPIAEMTPFAKGDLAAIAKYRIELCDEPPQAVAEPVVQDPKDGNVTIPLANNFLDEFKNASVLYSDNVMVLKKRIHEDILNKLNLTEDALFDSNNPELQQKVAVCLESTLNEHRHELPINIPYEVFKQALEDELTGFGPISPILRSERISEIMVNGANKVFVESRGLLYNSGVRFFNEQHLISIIQRIVEPLGRHVDEASPMVDARLPDGSRVNAVIPPLALCGATLTIRKFSKKKLTTDDLIEKGSLTSEMAMFLQEAVRCRKNIIVSGGTGSGKTTLLNILSQYIPSNERVITIEDSAELKLSHENLVPLEARPANIEGKGRITIRDLVINALRMRPDRIIVGECRGAEALDMLQAMNTGHDGSLTTLHANTARDALGRLENMVMMAGFELPITAIREQIRSAVNLIVQQTRMIDGSRKIVAITEVTGLDNNIIQMQDIFVFEQTGMSRNALGQPQVDGFYTATGNIPSFIEELRSAGMLQLGMDVFVPRV